MNEIGEINFNPVYPNIIISTCTRYKHCWDFFAFFYIKSSKSTMYFTVTTHLSLY